MVLLIYIFCLVIYLFIYLFVYLFTYLFPYLFIYLFICTFVCFVLFCLICLFVHLFVGFWLTVYPRCSLRMSWVIGSQCDLSSVACPPMLIISWNHSAVQNCLLPVAAHQHMRNQPFGVWNLGFCGGYLGFSLKAWACGFRVYAVYAVIEYDIAPNVTAQPQLWQMQSVHSMNYVQPMCE